MRQSDVGFLTLFEWYNYMEVGTYYKFPKFPVWIICSESHFSVIFLHCRESPSYEVPISITSDSTPLSLCYYDGLACQDDEIILTLTFDQDGGHKSRCTEASNTAQSHGIAIPPLELVLETRWPGVHVDWNGSEKIL